MPIDSRKDTVAQALAAMKKSEELVPDNYTLADLQRLLNAQIIRNGELDGRLANLSNELQRLDDRQNELASKSEAQIKERTKSLRKEIDKIKDDTERALEEEKGKLISSYNALEVKFAKLYEDADRTIQQKLEAISSLQEKMTIAALTKGFSAKAESEQKSRKLYQGWFYFLLSIALALGVGIAVYLWMMFPEGVSLAEMVKRVPFRFFLLMPVYVPLFWGILHFNRLAAQGNRLAEEYEHKKVVVDTYVGVSDQVENLAQKGVVSAKNLLSTLLERTIGVICYNPNNTLDKIKIATPISETANSVSKIADAVIGSARNKIES